MSRRKKNNKGSLKEFFLFLMIVLCIYFILSLFDSSLAGDSGRRLGNSLRASFGGAVIVLLLFWLYLSVALFMKFRVPLVPRQVLGTLQLYVSFAFMLGLLKEAGWDSQAALFMPGAFGHGLAKIFVLNIGTFITLLLVVGSFILSAYLYGSKILRISLPKLPSMKDIRLRFKRRDKPQRRTRRRREADYSEDRPERILFTRDINIPEPEANLSGDFFFDSVDIPKFKNPSGNNETEEGHASEQEPEPKKEAQNPVEVFDNLLAILDKAPVPEKKKAKPTLPPRKIRRPLRTSASRESDYEYESETPHDASVFPPPYEIFGPSQKPEIKNDTLNAPNEQGETIISTLKGFDVSATTAKTVEGASVTQYQLELAPGTKVSKAAELDGELAMALAVMSVRIEAPILGTHYVGIEVPKKERKTITFRSIIESDEFRNSTSKLPLALGIQNDGKVFVRGLEDMPHLLIAGSKGSGKSMFVNTCILSMCSVRSPDELKLILIDPRHVELSVYDGLPHLLSSTVSDSEEAFRALQWAVNEMETRTENFADTKTRNLAAFNRRLPKDKRLPEIVIVIDELADLIYSSEKNIEDLIVRLAQKAGVCGIHLIAATQRPSPEVITSLIKSNLPVCAAFSLSSKKDSENLLGVNDAFKLIGKGDMLFKDTEPGLTRLQTPFISEERISDFVDYMNNNLGRPDLIDFD